LTHSGCFFKESLTISNHFRLRLLSFLTTDFYQRSTESYRVNAFENNVIFGAGPGLKMIYSDCIFQNAFTLTSDTWESLKNAHRTIEYYLRLTHCTNIGNNGHYSVLDCTKSARPLQNGTFRSLSAPSKSIIVLRRYRK